MRDFTKRQVSIQFIKEGLLFTGEDSLMANLLLSVMRAFAEFERSLIKERQREGIALAKKKGVYKGRKRCLSPDQVQEIHALLSQGQSKAAIAWSFSISRDIVYQYLRREETL